MSRNKINGFVLIGQGGPNDEFGVHQRQFFKRQRDAEGWFWSCHEPSDECKIAPAVLLRDEAALDGYFLDLGWEESDDGETKEKGLTLSIVSGDKEKVLKLFQSLVDDQDMEIEELTPVKIQTGAPKVVEFIWANWIVEIEELGIKAAFKSEQKARAFAKEFAREWGKLSSRLRKKYRASVPSQPEVSVYGDD